MRDAVDDASTNEKQFDKALSSIAQTRELAASFLGTEAEEISLTGPTSSGLNMVANGLDWKAGDEVVCYLDDYPADVYPWLGLERQGVKPGFLEAPGLGTITPEILERVLTKRTRLVALASANYISGYRIDLEAIGALCGDRSVLFSVDGIQTLGAFPAPLTNIDFLSAGAQKWMLGPSGAGIFYVKEARQELLRPTIIGGWNVVSPNFIAQREVNFETGGRKFEPGAYTHSVIAGLRAAVELLLEAGPSEITERIRALTGSLRNQITPAGFEFLSPEEEKNRSGILTFRHPKVGSDRLWEALKTNHIVVSLRFDRADRGWLRISPHFYNTGAEIEKIAEVLKE